MIGNLGADAVINKIGDRSVINFSLCHSETWRKRQEEEGTKKYWVDCAYFVDNPELAKLLTRGKQVYAKGKPEVKIHVPKNGSDPIAVQALIVSKVEILSSKKKEEVSDH